MGWLPPRLRPQPFPNLRPDEMPSPPYTPTGWPGVSTRPPGSVPVVTIPLPNGGEITVWVGPNIPSQDLLNPRNILPGLEKQRNALPGGVRILEIPF
jgi:hypothetical protein